MSIHPRLSIVTVSFNQVRFLRAAIESVLGQAYPDLEYIVVDPGSTDGSRDVIREYGSQIDRVVFEKDSGPAEGLNNGFREATGDFFGFLNADDVLMPGAAWMAASALRQSEADVVSGHCVILDERGSVVRKAFSDRYSLKAAAYRECVLVQPSTFFSAALFREVGGFDEDNTSNWDAELWVNMALHGARFTRTPAILSGFRVHPGTITTSPDVRARNWRHQQLRFIRIMGRPPGRLDEVFRVFFRIRRYVLCPATLRERVLHGPLLRS